MKAFWTLAVTFLFIGGAAWAQRDDRTSTMHTFHLYDDTSASTETYTDPTDGVTELSCGTGTGLKARCSSSSSWIETPNDGHRFVLTCSTDDELHYAERSETDWIIQPWNWPQVDDRPPSTIMKIGVSGTLSVPACVENVHLSLTSTILCN